MKAQPACALGVVAAAAAAALLTIATAAPTEPAPESDPTFALPTTATERKA